jgi:hypothetical protein
MKMTDFFDIAPCSLVKVDRRFRGAYCFRHDNGEAVCMHEMSVYFNETTWRYISEGSHLQIFVCLNLNSVNQLISVMVKCGVLFEVRTEFLNNI